MGCFNSRSGDDDRHIIKADHAEFDDLRNGSNNHINFKQNPNYLMSSQFKGNNYVTGQNGSEYYYSYEEEEDENDTDSAYLYDEDYYNNKARLKRKMLPFIIKKEEKDLMKTYRNRKGIKRNNFPFWIIIFDYLGLEDIEIVCRCCRNFYMITQEDRILEKFIDSEDEEESESEDESNDLSSPTLKKRASSKKSHSNLVNEYMKISKKECTIPIK